MPSPKGSLSPTPEYTDTESTANVMPRPIPRSWPTEPPSPTLWPLPTPWPLLPTSVWSTPPWWACAPTTSVPRSHADREDKQTTDKPISVSWHLRLNILAEMLT